MHSEGSLFQPQFEQEPVGLSYFAAGSEPEDHHDLLAVEVWADGGKLFLLPQRRDSLFQVVICERLMVGLAAIARRDIGPREHVQALEQRPGIPHVPTHR